MTTYVVLSLIRNHIKIQNFLVNEFFETPEMKNLDNAIFEGEFKPDEARSNESHIKLALYVLLYQLSRDLME